MIGVQCFTNHHFSWISEFKYRQIYLLSLTLQLMKSDFILYKRSSKKPIVVNEKVNSSLLKRCQDHWYHKRDIKWNSKTSWLQKLSLSKSDDFDALFIHIPKTGGTSFKFNVLYNEHLKKKVAIYHLFRYPPKNGKSVDFFTIDPVKFSLVRDPVDTVISVYNHFNHIMNMSFTHFYRRHFDMQTKFLLGYDLLDEHTVTDREFYSIENQIREGNLVLGDITRNKVSAIYKVLELNPKEVDDYVLNKKVDGIKTRTNINLEQLEEIRTLNQMDSLLLGLV